MKETQEENEPWVKPDRNRKLFSLLLTYLIVIISPQGNDNKSTTSSRMYPKITTCCLLFWYYNFILCLNFYIGKYIKKKL